ncbi:MAG TPA: hypothetical protein VF799_03610, partial [Geobacteraceae bacterium]
LRRTPILGFLSNLLAFALLGLCFHPGDIGKARLLGGQVLLEKLPLRPCQMELLIGPFRFVFQKKRLTLPERFVDTVVFLGQYPIRAIQPDLFEDRTGIMPPDRQCG